MDMDTKPSQSAAAGAPASDLAPQSATPAPPPGAVVYYVVASPNQVPPGANVVSGQPYQNAPQPYPGAYPQQAYPGAYSAPYTPPATGSRGGFKRFMTVPEASPKWRSLAPLVASSVSQVRKQNARIYFAFSIVCFALYLAAGLVNWMTLGSIYYYSVTIKVSPLTNISSKNVWQILSLLSFISVIINLILSGFYLAKRVTAPYLFTCPSFSMLFLAVCIGLFKQDLDGVSSFASADSGFYIGIVAMIAPISLLVTLAVGLWKEKGIHETGGSPSKTSFSSFAVIPERHSRFKQLNASIADDVSVIRRKTGILFTGLAVISFAILLASGLVSWMSSLYGYVTTPFPAITPFQKSETTYPTSSDLEPWQALAVTAFTFSILSVISGILILVRWGSIVYLFICPFIAVGLNAAAIGIFEKQMYSIAYSVGYYSYGMTTETGYILAISGTVLQGLLILIAAGGLYFENQAHKRAPTVSSMELRMKA